VANRSTSLRMFDGFYRLTGTEEDLIKRAKSEELSVGIETLKSAMLRHTVLEFEIDPSVDIVGSGESMHRNGLRLLVKHYLEAIFQQLDKTENSEESGKIYIALEKLIENAIMLGSHNHHPLPQFLRQRMKDSALRAKRAQNIAAEKRRAKMRPLVLDAARGVGEGRPEILELNRLVSPVYKALMKQPEFVILLPKTLNPRQIKSDIQAILVDAHDEVKCQKLEDIISNFGRL
jgi:hypothetical protein